MPELATGVGADLRPPRGPAARCGRSPCPVGRGTASGSRPSRSIDRRAIAWALAGGSSVPESLRIISAAGGLLQGGFPECVAHARAEPPTEQPSQFDAFVAKLRQSSVAKCLTRHQAALSPLGSRVEGSSMRGIVGIRAHGCHRSRQRGTNEDRYEQSRARSCVWVVAGCRRTWCRLHRINRPSRSR